MKTKKVLVCLLLILLLVPTLVFAAGQYQANRYGDIVRIFGNVNVGENDEVAGNIVAVFGNINSRGDVRGDVVSIFGNTKLAGDTSGNVVSIFGNLDIDGQVKQNAVSVFGTLKLRENAAVFGDAVQVGMGNMDVDTRARIFGSSISTPIDRGFARDIRINIPGLPIMTGFFVVSRFASILMGLLFGFLIVVMMPDKVVVMRDQVENDVLKKSGIGLLSMFGLPVIMLFFALTIIGIVISLVLIPVLMVWIPLWLLIQFIGYVCLSAYIGKKVLGSKPDTDNAIYLELLVGMLLLGIVRFLPVIGPTLRSFIIPIYCAGLVLDTKFGTMRPWRKKGNEDNENNEKNHIGDNNAEQHEGEVKPEVQGGTDVDADK